jgi:hypothetical protein
MRVVRKVTTSAFAALEYDARSHLGPASGEDRQPGELLEGRARGSQLVLQSFQFYPRIHAAVFKA